MGFTRITEDDINNKGVVGLPDTPNLSTAEMQEKFDEIALAVIIPKVNNLIAEIEAKTASAGIGIDVDDELSEEKKLQPAFAKLYEIVKSLGSSNHSHDNKDALDGITDTLLTELNEIITLLDGITDVSNEINGRATALATCKAVADYVQELGGGDMTRAMYDTNRNGIVDDAEKLGGNLPEYYQSATDETLQTTDKTIVGAINEVKTGLENAEVDTLTTLEQVEASTDDTIPVGAGAVKELNESLEEFSKNFEWVYLANQSTSEVVIPECNELLIVVYDNTITTSIRGKTVIEYFLFSKITKIEIPCSNTDRDIWSYDSKTKKLSFESSSSTYNNFEFYYR